MATRRKTSQQAQDEDFYSTLAADYDSGEGSNVSDADVAELTRALADMDDMDDALFTSTLKTKKSPRKDAASKTDSALKGSTASRASKRSPGLSRGGTFSLNDDDEDAMFKTQDLGKKDPSKDLPEAPTPVENKPASMAKTFPGRSKSRQKTFDFGEFDEDDPLAGLLSDDEDAPKSKKKPTSRAAKKETPKAAASDKIFQDEKTAKPSAEPAASKQHKPVGTSQIADSLLDETGLQTTPRERDKKTTDSKLAGRKPNKKTDDIDFGDDDGILDGLGFDDSPREKPIKRSKDDEERQAAKAKVNDLFGKTTVLDKPPTNKGRFSDFQLDAKYKKPETAPAKEVTEEDFTFGGYTPSSIVSKRPDTAPPGRRAVRFADEDDDDIFGNSTLDHPRRAGLSRQSSATSSPSKSAKPEPAADDWLDEAVGLGSTYPQASKKTPKSDMSKQVDANNKQVGKPSLLPEKKEAGRGTTAKTETKKPEAAADYLGLGGADIDIDSLAAPKELTPREDGKGTSRARGDDMFSPPAKADNTSPFPWESGSPRRSRRRTPDLGSSFDNSFDYSFDADDGDDALAGSDPLRASLIAQQLKQLAAMERKEPGAAIETAPSTDKTASKPSTAASQKPSQPAQAPVAQSNKADTPGPKPASTPLQRQSAVASSPPLPTPDHRATTDHKPSPAATGQPTPGRREPHWRQELRQRQLQAQQSVDSVAVTPTTQAKSLSRQSSLNALMPSAAPLATPATPTASGMPQITSTPLAATTSLPGLDASLISDTQAQMDQQRQSMMEFEANMKQQQAQMMAEHEKQMRLIQEQKQKAMLQQQQQALQQQQQQALQQQQAMQQQQQQLVMQQQLQQSGASSVPGSGVNISLGAPPLGSSMGLGGTGAMQSPWIENKVRQLEAEKAQLESSKQLTDRHHKQQVETLESSHKDYISLLEETSRRREARILQEAEDSAARSEDRIQAVLAERSKVVSEHQARMELVYSEHSRELEKLKQMHSQEMDELRHQHKRELEETRNAMQQHIESMKDSTTHTQSLKDVVERVGVVGDQINSLQGRVSGQHQSQVDNRLQELREKEEEGRRMRRRLEEQEASMDQERQRLQATVSRLETHIKEQNIQLEEERWRLRQEQNKLSSLQKMVEEERRVMSDQLASQQTSLQQAKNAVLTEQQSIMGQCMEERKALATERAQFAAARREWEAKMKEEMSKASQEQAMREGTLESLSAERSQLAVSRETIHREKSTLEQQKQAMERHERELEAERSRLQRQGDSLQARSRELQGMVGDAVGVREEGEAALVKARKIEAQHNSKKQQIEQQLEELRQTERKLAQDRVQLAEEQRALERSAGLLLCQQCSTSLSFQNLHAAPIAHLPPAQYPFTSSGHEGGGAMHHFPPPLGGEPMPPMAVDRLLAQAEQDRTRNVWKLAANKDKDFLEEETSFLESLNNSYRRSQAAWT